MTGGHAATERPTLQDIAPLLERLQRTPTQGATLSCLALRLLWNPPGDLAALEELAQELAAAPESDPDIPYLHALTVAARQDDACESARALTAYAVALEHWGEEASALLVAATALRWAGSSLPARALVQIHLLRARLYRKAARWSEAAAAWAEVEELARVSADPWIAIRAKLGRVMLLRYRGNLPEAMRLAQEGLVEAREHSFTDLQAAAVNDLGTILENRGRPVDAAISYWEAVRLAPNEDEELRSLGNLAGMLRALGCTGGASVALRRVQRESSDWGDQTNAAIELLDVCSTTGDILGYYRAVRNLEGREDRMPPAMAADYHYRLGLACWRFGDHEKAKAEWNIAIQIAEAHELGAWIIRLEQEIANGPPAPPAPEDERACAVDLDVQVLLAGSARGSLSFGAGLIVGPGTGRIGAGRGPECQQDQEQSNQRASAQHEDTSEYGAGLD